MLFDNMCLAEFASSYRIVSGPVRYPKTEDMKLDDESDEENDEEKEGKKQAL